MFEKFGELNSFGEINELAENLFNEGDTESLRAMAKENGIQSDFVDMYLQGEIPALCDQLTAALGKIDVEVAELKPKEIMEDWVEYLRGQCMENELLAFNVRKDFWDDCNLYGLANISISAGQIMAETYEEMKGTMFRYSALQEYAKNVREVNPIEYLERYSQIPQIEVLVKLGLTDVVEKLVKCYYGIVADENARRPDQFLGIRKERVKQLIRKKGDTHLLGVMQMEKRQGQNWTDEQVEHLAETDLSGTQVEMATRYMTLQKLLNRIEKYSGCEYGTECSSASARIRHTATTYADYLSMRINLGYDLNNTVYQQPQDLEAEHNKMVMETNKEEMDKHLKEVAECYPEIRHVYRGLRNKYLYEDDKYIIRPARSAEEIVMEGRLLHHCVGGDTYLGRHNTGKTYILMLRFKAEPDVPYITVEIDAKNPRILQWYGDKDKKPDEKNMQSWLNTWLMKLKTGTLTETIQTAAIA